MIVINGNDLSITNFISVCRNFEKIKLDSVAIKNIKKSRNFVENAVINNEVIYGITTGFGGLCKKNISSENTAKLQENIVRSHAVGIGTPFNEEIARGIMLLRINTLSKGFSGIRLEIIELLIIMLNKRIFPYIPSQGSVGASGDLAPLSHLALILIGEGECLVNGNRTPSLKIFRELNIKTVIFKAKEGLALLNGTPVMTSLACFSIYDANSMIKHAQIASAMSLEALRGVMSAFDEKLHLVRPHSGQIQSAKNIRNLVFKSKILKICKDNKVQDAYCLRCMPQVFGGIIEGIKYISNIIAIEINSATDNPLIFVEQGEVISGGNFHGEPIALVMDFLGILLSELANISERRIDRLVNPNKSGLPPFLIRDDGLNSGFMIPQYTAAALVSENKVLAHPASVDSIPTSGDQEDHVSMGTISARHANAILKNTTHVIAIEFLIAAQALDFIAEEPGIGTKIAYNTIRKYISFMEKDRIIYKDMEKVVKLVCSEEILQNVQKAVLI